MIMLLMMITTTTITTNILILKWLLFRGGETFRNITLVVSSSLGTKIFAGYPKTLNSINLPVDGGEVEAESRP